MTSSRDRQTRRYRILIVDDHPIVRRGLRELMAGEPDLEVCGEADDAPAALRQIEATRPDVAVIDLSLKTGHGIELIRDIKLRDERIRMLVSSMHDESLFAERALRAGAMGYLNKQESPDKIIDAIRQILRGDVYLSPRMTARLLHRLVGGESLERCAVETLSDRELEVFQMIGQGLTTKQIAGKLHLSHKTIETHREKIKSKLNLKNSAELTRYATQWSLEDGRSSSEAKEHR